MRISRTKSILAVAGLSITLLSPLAVSHFDDKEVPQSYRQSFFTLMAMNFGPMVAMMKGEIPWDQSAFEAYANDLAAVANLNLIRGFPEGSHTGKTRAKPAIWDNLEDFSQKNDDLRAATADLAAAAATGDRAAIGEQFKRTGGACKSCHDDYKSEDYLN
ncbi:MAG: cytochrome c [Halioglobus sp.]